MGMPGGLSTNQVVNGRPVGLYYHDRNAATEIMDKSSSSSIELTLGGTYQLDKNFEIITDGGIRRTKNHFTDIDNAFGSHNNNRTYLDTWSLTPRLTGDFQFLGTPANTTLGLDWFDGIITTEIRPLVEEYWFDEPDKVKSTFSEVFGSL